MNRRLALVLTVAALLMGGTVLYFTDSRRSGAPDAAVKESASPIRNAQDLNREGNALKSTQVDSSAELKQNEQDANMLK